ncbi:MAG: hypothetical protein PHV37_01810 [Candidatus Gastranaerophilales bacterium]|nr:hypothetical protein [Candidatus Gastranaerophilales bacterium]
MSEIQGLLELVKPWGAGALLFACFFLYHKSTTEHLKSIIDGNFKVLNGMLENNIYHTALLQEIKDLIVNNTWCPYAKHFLNKEQANGKSNNNAN